MRLPLLAFTSALTLVIAAPLAPAQQQDPGVDSWVSVPSQATANHNGPSAHEPISGGTLSQTLGPWDLTPPDSASVVTQTGFSLGWLNVVNAPLTVSEAMASTPIEDGAYANAATADVIEVTFDSGVTNVPGADLVMLEAQFDIGTYRISSDFDGFVADVLLDTANATVVASASYFFEHNSGGPFFANIVGVEVDLSSIGVPEGRSVNSLRFLCVDLMCDPVSLAKINTGLTLGVSALAAGQPADFDVTGANPGGLVSIAYSTQGAGPTTIDTSICGPLSLDLSVPIRLLVAHPASAAGELGLSLAVPLDAIGLTVNFQAIDLSSCEVSNAVATTVQ